MRDAVATGRNVTHGGQRHQLTLRAFFGLPVEVQTKCEYISPSEVAITPHVDVELGDVHFNTGPIDERIEGGRYPGSIHPFAAVALLSHGAQLRPSQRISPAYGECYGCNQFGA